MLKLILTKGAKWLGKIKGGDVKAITQKIVEVHGLDIRGHEKAKVVVLWANDKFMAEKDRWIVQTVVQILFAVARMKGLLKK